MRLHHSPSPIHSSHHPGFPLNICVKRVFHPCLLCTIWKANLAADMLQPIPGDHRTMFSLKKGRPRCYSELPTVLDVIWLIPGIIRWQYTGATERRGLVLTSLPFPLGQQLLLLPLPMHTRLQHWNTKKKVTDYFVTCLASFPNSHTPRFIASTGCVTLANTRPCSGQKTTPGYEARVCETQVWE